MTADVKLRLLLSAVLGGQEAMLGLADWGGYVNRKSFWLNGLV
jgi:hypothetical protein